MDEASIEVGLVPYYFTANAGPVLTPLPHVEGKPSIGVSYRLVHVGPDGTLTNPFDVAILTNVNGAAVIIESLLFGVEKLGMIPALRARRDQNRASIRRIV